ncbi:MAG: hypothetical protein ACR2FN_10455 [Chitinophagaceae bacterium]
MAKKFIKIIFCLFIMNAAYPQTNQNKIQQALNNPETQAQSAKADTFILRSQQKKIKDSITTFNKPVADTLHKKKYKKCIHKKSS